MNRFWLGIGLLVLLLALSLWVTVEMTAIHDPISETLEKASRQTLSGDFFGGIASAQQAQKDWEQHRHATASVADHAPMDEIDGLFAELEIYARTGETQHFAATCAQLSRLIYAMGEAHGLGWWNLL